MELITLPRAVKFSKDKEPEQFGHTEKFLNTVLCSTRAREEEIKYVINSACQVLKNTDVTTQENDIINCVVMCY